MVLAALPVQAEPIFIGSTKYGNKYFVEANTKKTGNRSRVWILVNLGEAQRAANGGVYRSQRFFDEADCEEGRMRALNIIFYNEFDAVGEVVEERRTPEEWFYPPPGTISSSIFEYLCGKKP